MAANTSTVYDFTLNDIDGKPVSLSQYKGKVIMLVNTASFCGNTRSMPTWNRCTRLTKTRALRSWPSRQQFRPAGPGSNEEIKGSASPNIVSAFPSSAKSA